MFCRIKCFLFIVQIWLELPPLLSSTMNPYKSKKEVPRKYNSIGVLELSKVALYRDIPMIKLVNTFKIPKTMVSVYMQTQL